MRRCAICGDHERVYYRWLGGPHAVCWPCRQSIAAAYERGPVRHRDRAGREAYLRTMAAKRIPCPANTGQQASAQQASRKEQAA
jgi:hypothetical protein